MDHVLPPICDPHRLGAELERVPFEDREDAAQEAWAAHLAGRDPVQAVNTFVRRERRQRRGGLTAGAMG